MLDQFDATPTLGTTGRTAHKGATLELRSVATMIAQTVRVMDARTGSGSRTTPCSWGRGSVQSGCLWVPKGSGLPAPGRHGITWHAGHAGHARRWEKEGRLLSRGQATRNWGRVTPPPIVATFGGGSFIEATPLPHASARPV